MTDTTSAAPSLDARGQSRFAEQHHGDPTMTTNTKLSEQTGAPALADALAMLIREAQEVADDHHRPRYTRLDVALASARAVLAKWGMPQPVAPSSYVLVPVEVANLYDFMHTAFVPMTSQHEQIAISLDLARKACGFRYIAAGAVTSPAVVEPLTPIRQAALDLYTPPFRHEHGYIRDANNQMVADDAGSEASGLIAARIRGWGRIQYMDNPEGRAGALQDEVAEMVAEALNAFWAAHGIAAKPGAPAPKENDHG